jgi:putative membrane protein
MRIGPGNRLRWPAAVVLAASSFHAVPAWAHSPSGSSGQEQMAALLTALALAAFWGLYLRGSLRKRPRPLHAACFHTSAALCYLAVLGPLDDWAEVSAAMHMTQHMLFMMVIAPLWVLSQPLPQLAAGSNHLLDRLWRPLLRFVQHPMLAAYVHGAIIWVWHTPYFYTLALENPWWHALEHTMFLGSAGLFWWAVLKSGLRGAPWALLALLFTLMHTGFLGAVLTFAEAPLYGEARHLQDQQLAGLIMWVLGAIPYLAASVWVGHRWYRQLQRRMA